MQLFRCVIGITVCKRKLYTCEVFAKTNKTRHVGVDTRQIFEIVKLVNLFFNI